ncbi:IS66 family insertion sequence element accessory protein TnpB [Castellaniella sp.]|uniref:IS66 family insertion sequence element accessory protein TnpB n=1 Tax=Castellaniella sp. TaxID=1955812 RepID=UPI002AFE1C77|nr:IS66 family insertion sequence element accessory protein TnpB [Castellaniella sp.]
MIRVERIWLAVDPMDMRAGVDTALARVVQVFGAARPHHAYVFANRRATRIKVLMHDGIGVWLAARRLHQGKFVWPDAQAQQLSLSLEQAHALMLGLPWQRLGEAAIIDCI